MIIMNMCVYIYIYIYIYSSVSSQLPARQEVPQTEAALLGESSGDPY